MGDLARGLDVEGLVRVPDRRVAEPDEAKAREIYQKSNKLITEDAAFVPVVDDRQEVAPGDVTYGRFRLEAPVCALPGDRYVIRSYSPIVTIGDHALWVPMEPR